MFWLKSVIFRLVKISGLFWLNSVVFNTGLPRRVNETALLALKEAMDRGAHTVTADMVRLVSKKWWEK